jgi:NarL family two-component system response regulator LiaR
MDKIKVGIVEDDLDWLKCMTIFLNNEDDIFVAGSATNKDEAVRMAKSMAFDVILMDINLNENKCDGILTTVEIRQFSDAKIIMLTSLDEKEIILDSFTAGAVNYVSKSKYMDIPGLIRDAFNNKSPIEVVLNEFSQMKKNEQLKDLTQSEKQVFDLLEKGYTKSRIESELFKTTNTVKTQIKHILRKLGVSNSKEAVQKVQTKGLKDKLRERK